MQKQFDNIDFLRLIDALAIFIKQKQTKVKEIKNMLKNFNKINNLSWTNKYFIQIHDFIAM